MTDIQNGRFTAAPDGPLVLFLIGMRINKLIAVGKWWPVAQAMPRMLRELSADKSAGLLGFKTWISGRNVMVLQYWKSFDHLTAYAHDRDAQHFPAWTAFNRAIGGDGTVGIWHETYRIEAGGFECIYGNMPKFGLAAATAHVPATGRLAGARSRMSQQADEVQP